MVVELSYLGQTGRDLPMVEPLNYVPEAYRTQSVVRDTTAETFLTQTVSNPFQGLFPDNPGVNGSTASDVVAQFAGHKGGIGLAGLVYTFIQHVNDTCLIIVQECEYHGDYPPDILENDASGRAYHNAPRGTILPSYLRDTPRLALDMCYNLARRVCSLTDA
jgi:hypothetical protein